MTFLELAALDRLKENKVSKIFNLLDWESLEMLMGKLGRSGYGPRAYAPIKMLKALILQAWHSLSDGELEEALRIRLDFMVMTGLEEVPDATTLCRFRNKLMELRGCCRSLLT
jgi:IS5 family transposase